MSDRPLENPPINPMADPLVEVVDSDAASPTVRLEADPSGWATIVLNRPERKNAFNAEMIGALDQALETLEGADGVRTVFVRGAGGTFSAGADLEWMRRAADWPESDNREDAMALAVMLRRLWQLPKFTVALVEGSAFGGGNGLIAACDHAIAVKSAKFAFSEVKLGLVAATISPFVIAAIGPRKARGLFASGRTFGAAEAHAMGLIDEVVADAAALETARERIFKEISSCAPGALAASKRLVDEVAGRPIGHELSEATAHAIAKARVSEEGQEGVRAFLEGRRAAWRQ
ncbi:MAG: enoyl-CoA hydratase-related protein [Caulobacteraceae bacterium]